jgi:hypothetical protein
MIININVKGILYNLYDKTNPKVIKYHSISIYI